MIKKEFSPLYPIKVLIVEDIPPATQVLESIVDSEPNVKVIGHVNSGEQALEFIYIVKPDVIIMDIALPGMDGFETTHRIMQTTPIPIIIVSTTFQPEDVEKSFKAISAGALEILAKPVNLQDPSFKKQAKALITSIKHAAMLPLTKTCHFSPSSSPSLAKTHSLPLFSLPSIEAIAIGASLGGPSALNSIFSQLPAEFPVPIFVVQHISAGFSQGLVDWLKNHSSLKIKLAEDQELAKSGCVYIAPDYYHLEIDSHHLMHLSEAPLEDNLCPSVARLFRSMAKTYGSHGMGIILTGMGHDGAEDLLLMKKKGGFTIAQDPESSLMFGMPKEAISIGAVNLVLSLQQIIALLKSLL